MRFPRPLVVAAALCLLGQADWHDASAAAPVALGHGDNRVDIGGQSKDAMDRSVGIPTQRGDTSPTSPKFLMQDAPGPANTATDDGATVGGEIISFGLAPCEHRRLIESGFVVRATEMLDSLDLPLTIWSTPPGLGDLDALQRMRELAPDGTFDLNHLYRPTLSACAPVAIGQAGYSLMRVQGLVGRHHTYAETRQLRTVRSGTRISILYY